MVASSVAKWTATSRHATMPDGSKRILYKNPKHPGETRIRKMRKGRDGKMKAAYVKPPGGGRRFAGGGECVKGWGELYGMCVYSDTNAKCSGDFADNCRIRV